MLLFWLLVVIFNHIKSLLKSGTSLLAPNTCRGIHSIVACYLYFAPEQKYLSHFGKWDNFCNRMDKHCKQTLYLLLNSAVAIQLIRFDLNWEGVIWCAQQFGKCAELPPYGVLYKCHSISNICSLIHITTWSCQNPNKPVFVLEYSYVWMYMKIYYLMWRTLLFCPIESVG